MGLLVTNSIMERSISILDFDTAPDSGLPVLLQDPTRDRMNLAQLETFFQGPEDKGVLQKRRLFLIKHPPIEERKSRDRLQYLLQSQLGVPASLFQAHRRTHTISHFTETINFPRLPTAISPRSRFSLEYFELWEVMDNEEFSYHVQTASTVECVATGRQMQCHKWITRPGWLLIAPRKCSFWARKHDSGWNGETCNGSFVLLEFGTWQ